MERNGIYRRQKNIYMPFNVAINSNQTNDKTVLLICTSIVALITSSILNGGKKPHCIWLNWNFWRVKMRSNDTDINIHRRCDVYAMTCIYVSIKINRWLIDLNQHPKVINSNFTFELNVNFCTCINPNI